MLMIKLVDARRGLHEKCVELFHNEKVAESIYMYLCDGIEECDAVEPERKMGEWIYHTEPLAFKPYGHYTCSLCNEIAWDESNYCPNCGADMRQREETNK